MAFIDAQGLTGASPGGIPPANMFPSGAGTGSSTGAVLSPLLGALGGQNQSAPGTNIIGGEMLRAGSNSVAPLPTAVINPDAAMQQDPMPATETTPAGQPQGGGLDIGKLAQMIVGTGATIADRPEVIALMQWLTQMQGQAGKSQPDPAADAGSDGKSDTPAAATKTNPSTPSSQAVQSPDPVKSQEGQGTASSGQPHPSEGNAPGSAQPMQADQQGQNTAMVGGTEAGDTAAALQLLQILAPHLLQSSQQLPQFQPAPLPDTNQVFNQGLA